MTDRLNPLILVLLVACVALNLYTIPTWDNSYVSSDGVQYISTAGNWLAGRGFSTDVLHYAPHFQGVLPAPQTVWPPGFPLAIALVSSIGLELSTATLLLNLITYALASMLMGLILIKAGLNRRPALLCSLLFYLMAKPWTYALTLSTEPLFLSLIFATTLALPDPRKTGLLKWILCGVLLALCIYVRYSAVFFALAVGVTLFLYLIIYRRKPLSSFLINCSKLALLTLLPVLAFAHLMFRTQSLIGTFDRYSGSKKPETFASTLRLWVTQTSEFLGFNNGGILKHGGSIALFIVFIALILFLISVFFNKRLHTKNQLMSVRSMDYFRLTSLLAVTHSLALATYLTVSSMSDTPLEIINRYIYQIYPGLYIVFCIMAYTIVQHSAAKNFGRPNKALTITIGALASIFVTVQANELLSSRKPYLQKSRSANAIMSLPATPDITISSYVRRCLENADPQASIWSTRGQHLHLNTGLSIISHDHIYTRKPFDPIQLKQQIKDYNIKMFVFVEIEGEFGPQYTNRMVEIKDWLSSKQYSTVPLLEDRIDNGYEVAIYTKTPACGLKFSQ